jgi:subtilase family serine protease
MRQAIWFPAATAAPAALLISLLFMLLAGPAAAAPVPTAVAVPGSAPRSFPGPAVAATPASSPIEFSVDLRLSDSEGAIAFARAVSEPGSPGYRSFLTPAQWERRFSPTQRSLAAVTSWLRSEGASVDGVTTDRMTVEASAPASTVARIFHTSLAEYRLRGRPLRLAAGTLSVPAGLSGLISSVSGVDQKRLKPAALGLPGSPARAAEGAAPSSASEALAAPATKPIPPPEWPLSPPPCSIYSGEKLNEIDPPFGAGYPGPLPWATCGYKPSQLQGAYDLGTPIASGDDGKGITVAITDAYASNTLYADAHEWSKRNGPPSQLLKPAQFTEAVSPTFNEINACGASGWSIEQTLDVESVHAMAPGAHILYVGAKNCEAALFKAVQTVVDLHLADVVSNSWTEYGTEAITPIAENSAFDNVLLMAAGTGVGVQFSSGDEGDDFSVRGDYAPQYPPESPYATGVGGTSVEVGSASQRLEELGWSGSISALCSAVVEEHEKAIEAGLEHPIGCTGKLFGKWLPRPPGGYWAGGGGGTSFEYPEPYYQQGVVPAALAKRNQAVTGTLNRVVPDMSMDADPLTGLKMGETLAEPGGALYEEFPIGGTSLASPLLAGVLADADQRVGGSLGFINPLLYRLAASPATFASAFNDILAPKAKQAVALENLVNGDNAEQGSFTTALTMGYEGNESYCLPEGGECTEHKITLKAAKGFDSMTGIGSPGGEFIQELAAAP